jgi:hypothetical protein
MNQEVLRTCLRKKSKSYALVWAYIYAHATKTTFKGSVAQIETTLRVSRSTITRALKEGHKVDENILYHVSCDVLDVSWKKQKTKAPVATSTLYKDLLSEYNSFILEKTGLGAKINTADGAAMKRIIAYLKQQVKEKDDVEASVVEAWRYVLSNWSKLSAFYQSQVKLVQIDSNFPNILTQLRNNPKQQSNESRLEKFRNAANRDAESGFGPAQ